MPSTATADDLIAWFDARLESMPLTSLTTDDETSDFKLLVSPPVGITVMKVGFRSVPLARSGPKGWTYFPLSANGTRLARLSYQSLIPGVYVTAMVKLVDKAVYDDDETEVWSVSEHALLTIDNLTGHGSVELRKHEPGAKRRKVCIRY